MGCQLQLGHAENCTLILPAGFKNEYIGGTACTTCNAAVSGYTSTPGADYCTVPYFATTACGAGKEYDDALRTCVNCAKGTAGTNTCTAW